MKQFRAAPTRRSPVMPGVILSLILSASATAAEPSRGQQLYELHCVACHSEQIHWRERGIVRSWQGLLAQVRHWQAYRVLHWSDEDVKEVARYLNDSIYHLPQNADEVTLRSDDGPAGHRR